MEIHEYFFVINILFSERHMAKLKWKTCGVNEGHLFKFAKTNQHLLQWLIWFNRHVFISLNLKGQTQRAYILFLLTKNLCSINLELMPIILQGISFKFKDPLIYLILFLQFVLESTESYNENHVKNK